MPNILELIRIIEGEPIFGFEIDSQIRQASKELPASLIIEIFRRCCDSEGNWSIDFIRLLLEYTANYEPTVFISKSTQKGSSSEEVFDSEIVYYLKLIFCNEDAAYYQFPVFPAMDDPLLAGGARKREGAIQHLKIELLSRNDFQKFIERLGGNPHLTAIEDSSEDKFNSAPSNAI